MYSSSSSNRIMKNCLGRSITYIPPLGFHISLSLLFNAGRAMFLPRTFTIIHCFHNPFIVSNTSLPMVITGSPSTPSGNSNCILSVTNPSSITLSASNLPPTFPPLTLATHDPDTSGGSPGGLPPSPTSIIGASCVAP
ncbi:unnamed protein product, partial [Arabidopsis halleri]